MSKNDDLSEDKEKENEKNNSEGKQTLTSEEIKARKELLKTKDKLEAAEEENLKLKNKLAEAQKAESAGPSQDTIEQLKAQVDLLSKQVVTGALGGKLKFREPTAADLVPEGEEVTFTARNVLYVVASYRDYRGIEKMPPHKLIVFQYAASDVRKEGREDTVKNFCQYTTNLKTEIAYLRDHPFYGITFSENTNEMLDEDALDTQFKVRAATQLASATPENIFARAEQYKIPNFRSKSAEQLRILVVSAMAIEFKKEQKILNDEIAKRSILVKAALSSKTE